MRLIKYLLNEKFTKREIKDISNNENIGIGAEFEFICYKMEEYKDISDDIRREYEDAVDDGRGYTEEKERLKDEIHDLKNDKDESEDEKTGFEEELENLENEDDIDYDRLRTVRGKISNLEDKISDMEIELESSEKNLEDLSIGTWYITYMERYIGQYEIDDELSEPPTPEDLGFLGSLKDEQEGKHIAQDVLPPIIEDAPGPIKNYEIGGYKEIKQKKGNNTGAFEYDGSISPDGGVEMKTPPMKLPEFLEILPDILDGIDDNGYTIESPSTGLHFHMSVGNVNNIQFNIDMVKLILFLEENFIGKIFPERMLNSYTKEVKGKILRGMKSTNVSNYISDLMGNKSIDPNSISDIMGSHYDAVRKVEKATGNHVEFRHPGGRDYHKKLKEIEKLIGRYALTLSLAVDPNYKKKEYIQKVIRILNKIEGYKLDIKLTFYSQISEITNKNKIMGFFEIPILSDSKFDVLKSVFKKQKKQIQKEMDNLNIKPSNKERTIIGDKIDANIVILEEKNYIRSLLKKM